MRNWLLALQRAFFLVLLQLLYINLNWVAPVEEDIVEFLTKAEAFFFHPHEKDNTIIFVNTGYAAATTTVVDKGDTGSISITDRQKLAVLFSYLAAHNNQHKYVLCDVRFTNPSTADDSLQKAVNKLTKYIFPVHINAETNKIIPAVIKGNSAVADYITYRFAFSKMMLYQKCNNSLPLQMYIDTPADTGRPFKFVYTWFGLIDGFHSIPNSIFPRYYYRKEDLEHQEIGLDALLRLIKTKPANDTAFYNSFFKNSIIVIGNFNDDVQPTPVGFLPGTLILLNSYLTLYHYDSYSIWYLLFLFICFTFISYYVARQAQLQEKFISQNYAGITRFIFSKGKLFYTLVILSVAGDLIFSIRSTVLLLTLYFLLSEHRKKHFSFHKK